MRLRNVKNKEEILNNCHLLIKNPQEYKGKWKELFGNDNQIYIEIGMGKGDFIIENALKNKNINYIGIEKFDSVLAKAIPKLPEIKNLKVLRFDAINIEEIFDHEIDLIYLNFSDPWPKNRHAFRRLTSNEFLKRYESLFKDEKKIEMKTDNEDLFTFSIETLSQNDYELSEVYLDYHKKKEDIIMSEYETKFFASGKKLLNLFAKKRWISQIILL